ncbi:hypothetical protein B0O99DRAFT_682193 [Bisporella sp. PMI_857]|nr:hypothetical protein B0O99DRAFT_682193 [Bisporella sp. PMI_857]
MGDANLAACATLQLITSTCNVLTPGFSTITNDYSLAECYCYNRQGWNPNFYDAVYVSCINYYLTASPTVLASFVNAGNTIHTAPCSELGNFKPNVDSGPITTGPGILACSSLDGYYGGCNSKTPGFSTITNPIDLARCLCYSQDIWQPNAFDSPWRTCASYLYTANPTAYQTLFGTGVLQTQPCGIIGDIKHTTSINPGPSPGPSPSPNRPSQSNPGLSVPSPTTPVAPSSNTPNIPNTPSASGTASTRFTQSFSDSCSITSKLYPELWDHNFYIKRQKSSDKPCLLRHTGHPKQLPSPQPGFHDDNRIQDRSILSLLFCVVWQPSKYDSVWAGCVSYLSTEFPAEYSVAASTNPAGYTAPCSFAGDVLAGSQTVPGSGGRELQVQQELSQ